VETQIVAVMTDQVPSGYSLTLLRFPYNVSLLSSLSLTTLLTFLCRVPLS